MEPNKTGPFRSADWRVAATIILIGSTLSGCVLTHDRAPVPAGLAASAQIGQVKLARTWGDQFTPEARALIDHQYDSLKSAMQSPQFPRASRRRADFLAISGGGSDGAYAAGVLVGWTEKGDRPHFEVVTGVSTGALAAPFAFLGSRYDGQLEQIFTLYGDGDIYTNLGLIGVVGRSLYDSKPLRSLIGRYLTEHVVDAIAAEYRIGRRLLIQTTNIDAQRPVIWDISAIAASERPDRREIMIDVLLASAAIPAVFPPVRIDVEALGRTTQELHIDGGTVSQLLFAPPGVGLNAFERRHFGRVRDRRLFVILNGKLAPDFAVTEESALKIARRAIATIVKYQSIADLTRLDAQARAAGAQLRFTAIPREFSAIANSEFDREYMQRLFALGRRVGRQGTWSSHPSSTPGVAMRSQHAS